MFDLQERDTVQMRGRGRFTLTSRLRQVLSRAADQVRAASPFKVGDYLALVYYDYRQLRKPW